MNVSSIVLTIYLCILGYNGCYSSDQNDDVILNDSFSNSQNNSGNQSNSTPVPGPSNLTHVTLDIKNNESTDKITYEYNHQTQSCTFTPKQGYVIDKVTKGDTVLWESKDYGFQLGNEVYIGKNDQGDQIFRVKFGGTVPRDISEPERLAKALVAEPKPHDVDVTVPHSDPEDDDDEDTNKPILHLNLNDRFSTDKVTYELSIDGVETFTAVEPYSFILITKGSYIAWRYEHGEFPNKVLILKDENANPFMRLEFPKPKPKILKTVSERRIKLPKTEEEPAESVSIPLEIESQVIKQLNSRLSVDLNVQLKSNSYNCEHNRKGLTHIYTAKTDYLFHIVRVGDFVLWTARDRIECVNKVEYTPYKFPGMYEVNLYHFVGGKKKFIKNVGPWRHVDLTKTALYTVNLDSIFDTFGYENCFDGTFGIFDVKSPFLFDRIIKYNGPGSSVTDIWQAKNPSEYAKRVVIDGAQPFQNTNFVMVIFNNNKRKYFLRINNQWVEVPY